MAWRAILTLVPVFPRPLCSREVTAVDGATLAAADGTPLHLPHGTWVHFAIWALHRSEQHWRQPLAYRCAAALGVGALHENHSQGSQVTGKCVASLHGD